ncbi:MAG TPA: hypothetical protein VEI82_11270 [Myxococcota bacterium]|nr:hypothetical protein [Myxococcota bacterium]
MRLPPDARALHALGEISALLGGESPTPAEAAFASGSWMITQRGAQVGLLSAYPSFESILSLLEQWAEHERARPGAVSLARNPKPDAELARLLSTFDDAAAFEVLEKVDARWAKGRASVGDLLAASEALAQLALLFPNGSLAKDAVEARALGSLALAKTYAPGATLRIEAQIAHALDYGADARAAGAQLPESDPLRAFLFRDVPALERAVAQKSASPETLFLYGRALVLGSEPDEWIEWYQGLSKRQKWTASVAVAPVDVGSVPTGHGAANLYAAILLTRSGVSIPDAEGFDAPLLLCPQLGAAVAARAKGRPGRFADAAFERAAYEGACIAALRAKLTFYVDWLGDPASALALAKKLPREGAPELADLRSWTELVAGRSRDLSALEKRLAQPSTLAPSERDRLSGRALALLPLRMGSQAMDVADSLARSLDSRPASREIASRLAMDVYRDSGLAEDLYGATSDAFGDDRPDLRAYLASFRGDLKTLWSIAESPDQPARILRDALRDLDVDPDRPRLRAAYEAAIGKHPDDQTLRRDFATFLGKKLDDHEAAREELRAVLGTHPDGLVADVIISEVARLYRLDKRYGDSWALVAPRLEGEVGGILARAFAR